MTGWIRWTAPAAAMISLSAPAHAVQYLSVSEAQKLAFPSASFTEVQPGRVWKTSSGGIFVLDHVIGKHLYIDYAVSIVRRPRPPRRYPAIPRVLWRRGQKPKLAGAIRRQDQQQPAESGRRHPQYFRRHPVLHARDRRREENFGRVWTSPIAFAASSRCWALSSRLPRPVPLAATCKKRSTTPSPPWRRCTGS